MSIFQAEQRRAKEIYHDWPISLAFYREVFWLQYVPHRSQYFAIVSRSVGPLSAVAGSSAGRGIGEASSESTSDRDAKNGGIGVSGWMLKLGDIDIAHAYQVAEMRGSVTDLSGHGSEIGGFC